MSHHCPTCNGVLYDRRRKACGFCGAAVPAELLFTPAELEHLRVEEAWAEETRRQLRVQEAAEEEAKARAFDGLLSSS
ncbi:MAG TPA: hypothetical protein VK846_05145 [Candidatus Limnocylindria bacterium]|nr:hypothetical protein [Candidatus Limnocylindria bacterium]